MGAALWWRPSTTSEEAQGEAGEGSVRGNSAGEDSAGGRMPGSPIASTWARGDSTQREPAVVDSTGGGLAEERPEEGLPAASWQRGPRRQGRLMAAEAANET